ncbi:MAG TPA: amidohydrolase [Flavobacterium sp.]|jgi:predicted amidohydrolase
MSVLKLVLVQTVLQWENAAANRDHIEEMIKDTQKGSLVLLPEMFPSGFTMNPEAVAETVDGTTVSWMKRMASEYDSAICGSVVITENGKYYNRLFFVYPSGETKHYDKKHLFSLAGEHKVYTPGTQKLIVEYKGWKICPLVCYDLRFPVFSRNTEDYDLLIYVANWPRPRISAWDILLKARAVENMCYVAAVNRIGSDNNSHQYTGHSQVVDHLGNYVAAPDEKQGVRLVEINKQEMLEVRQKLGFLNDRDAFTVK